MKDPGPRFSLDEEALRSLESMLFILENEKRPSKGPRREVHINFSAILFRHFYELPREIQDRFIAVVEKGTPEDKQRMATLVENR